MFLFYKTLNKREISIKIVAFYDLNKKLNSKLKMKTSLNQVEIVHNTLLIKLTTQTYYAN